MSNELQQNQRVQVRRRVESSQSNPGCYRYTIKEVYSISEFEFRYIRDTESGVEKFDSYLKHIIFREMGFMLMEFLQTGAKIISKLNYITQDSPTTRSRLLIFLLTLESDIPLNIPLKFLEGL